MLLGCPLNYLCHGFFTAMGSADDILSPKREGDGEVPCAPPRTPSTPDDGQTLVLFQLGGQRYALHLSTIDRVIRAVAVTPVPETPAFVLGVINLAGQLLPVCSLRSCLGLPDRDIRAQDLFVIARTSGLTVALVVDDVSGLVALDAARTVAPETVLPGHGCRVEGLVKLGGDIILIYNLEQLFSAQDQARILQAQSTVLTALEAGLLLSRATALARESQAASAAADNAIEVLEFGLADETYAFELPPVRAVFALLELTPLPGVPGHVLGITCAHGQIIAVVDLRKIFNLPGHGLRDSHQVIVLQSETMEFGILAERIAGVRRLSLKGLQTSLPTLTDVRAAYLTGITPEGTVILSAAKLLADPQLVVHQQWGSTP